MNSYGKVGSNAPPPTAFRRDWICETFTVNRDQLANVIALHLDFGILAQGSLGRLLGAARLGSLKNIQIDANKRALFFLNHIAAKHANPKLQDIATKYFVTNSSLKDYVRPEAGELLRTC